MAWGVAILMVSAGPARAQSLLPSVNHAAVRHRRPATAPVRVKAPKKKQTPRMRPAPSLFGPMPGEYDNRLWVPLAKHILSDQYAIWTSPKDLRLGDAGWLVPFGGLAAGMFATDKQFSRHLSNSPSRLKNFDHFSTYAAYTMAGGAAAMYFWGHFTHNEHLRETGFLSGEAAIDSLIATEALKYSFRRARPLNPGAGDFWHGGTSFPSEHSDFAWSVAGIVAHEYPGPLTKLLAYGLASAISIARVPAKKHFPSDVLVGGLIGYLVSRQVYLAHHNPELGGGSWHLFPMLRFTGKRLKRGDMGSPYVPLDSWVYPAFERLIAMGYVKSAMLGMRPWTRLECVRLLEQAENRVGPGDTARSREALPIIRALQKEFKFDIDQLAKGKNQSLELDSLYARVTGINGKPLTDGYHFGQTIINDYGRPYEEGFNAIAGFTGWGTMGPFVGYLQGEYQHAPSAPPLPLQAREVISRVDGNLPLMPPLTTPTVNRFRVINGYAGLTWHNWQLTGGRQSLWWGPDQGGPMMFSDNAQPVDMIQLNRVSPFRLPSILRVIGPMRVDFFIGRLSGQEFTAGVPTGLLGQWGVPLNDQPMLHGEALSFKPTPNLEFGFTETGIFAGAGVPLTWATTIRAIFSPHNGVPGCYIYSPQCPKLDPGDRRSGFDMTYRLPFLRNWVTFYTDSFSDDEFSPVAYFDRSANSAGLYFDRLPKLPNVTLRVEGVYTDNPLGGNLCCGFYYFNDRYRNGYTNDGNLIGSWIGRDGQGVQAWLTYWKGARDSFQLQFRHQKVSHQFIPDGGTLTDGGLKVNYWLRRDLSMTGLLQYEKWDFPILRPGHTTDFTTSVQLTYWPRWRLH
jgi:membrane-associated phospholipid phosphatase